MLNRRNFITTTAALGALALAGCSSDTTDDSSTDETEEESTDDTEESDDSSTEDATATTYKIGVLQLVQHSALDLSNDGFIRALDEYGLSYEVDQQNAANDTATCTTIANTFVGNEVDLIYCIATGAAQAAAAVTTEIPIVGCAITDYAGSDLVEDNDAPGGNVTGASDLPPVAEQISLLHTLLPDAQTVALLYCSAESNSEIQIEMAEEACEELGLTSVRYSVASSNEIQSVCESMAGAVDAVYAPTDNTIAAATAQVGSICLELGLPYIAGEESMFEDGNALATYTIDYEALGYIAGNMAIRILVDGEDPAEMPIEYTSEDDLTVLTNEEVAEQLGVDLTLLDA